MATIYYDKDASLDPLRGKTVAVIGYGSQGHAHAQNLRDSGVNVVVGLHEGSKGREKAKADGLDVTTVTAAIESSDIVMFFFPDQVIPQVYQEVTPLLAKAPRPIGFAHGFALTFGLISKIAGCSYFLVGPKGAGALLRDNFVKGGGLPGNLSDESKRQGKAVRKTDGPGSLYQ